MYQKKFAAEFAGQLESHKRFHGFVDDVTAFYMNAKPVIALVPEVIGGGFKLKFLDYIFGRVPVASISAAAAGLPVEVRQATCCSPQIARCSLSTAVIEHIDRARASCDRHATSMLLRLRARIVRLARPRQVVLARRDRTSCALLRVARQRRCDYL